MAVGHGWPFCEMPDGYAREMLDEYDALEDEREAREDRAADHTPANAPGFPYPLQER